MVHEVGIQQVNEGDGQSDMMVVSREQTPLSSLFLTYLQFPVYWYVEVGHFRRNGCWDMWADLFIDD